jgi:hypothetical protein
VAWIKKYLHLIDIVSIIIIIIISIYITFTIQAVPYSGFWLRDLSPARGPLTKGRCNHGIAAGGEMERACGTAGSDEDVKQHASMLEGERGPPSRIVTYRLHCHHHHHHHHPSLAGLQNNLQRFQPALKFATRRTSYSVPYHK